MAELLSPGVFIEEVPSQQQIITAVSTSTFGIAGFTPKGPTDEATIVGSFQEFSDTFGEIVADSYLGETMAAFFNNGGVRSYVVRVVPSDAIAATAYILSKTYDQELETGDGSTTAFTKTAATSLIKDNGGTSPVHPESFSLRWRSTGTPVVTQSLWERDLSDQVALVNSTEDYEGRINPKAWVIVPGAANGDILYQSVGDGRNDISIIHLVAGLNTVRSIGVSGTVVTVTVATDGLGAVATSETANSIAASVNGTPAAAALVTATAQGTGLGLVAAAVSTPLVGGLCDLDQALDGVIRGTFSLVFDPDGGGDRSINIPEAYASLTGRIWTIRAVAGASIVDGETFTIDDGISTPTVFEFDSNATVTAGRVAVTFTALDTVTQVRNAIISAINGVGNLLAVTAVDSGTSLVLLTHDSSGSIVLSESVANTGFTAGTSLSFDHRSGTVSVKFAGSDIPSAATTDLRASYTPASAPVPSSVSADRTVHTAVDNGSGNLLSTSFVSSGTLTYTTGAYSFTCSSAPHDRARILATYTIKARALTPVSKGAWANDFRVDLRGEEDYLDVTTATYSKFTCNVLEYDEASATYVVLEQFESTDLDTPTDKSYFPDVINALSDYVRVGLTGADEAPGQLNGVSRVQVIGGGDEGSPGRTFSVVLEDAPIAQRSVVISYINTSGETKTVTDTPSSTSAGTMTGSVDISGTNTISYPNGAIEVTLDDEILGGTLVTVRYASAPEETTHSEIFGDTTKSYTAGSDGTFTSSTYSRDQFTSPALIPDSKGIYALNAIDELMQVAIPDFAGDTTVTGDLLDYVESRRSQPAGGDRFVLLTTPQGLSAQDAVAWIRYTLGRYSKYAACYWPWIKIADTLANGRPLTVPPLGHIAGVYARTDNNKNVGKAPAGTVDGALNYCIGLERIPTQTDRDLVSPARINSLVDSVQTGRAVWGTRTMASPSQSEWRHINATRLFMFLEKSIFNSTHWVVFENNGPALWTRITAQLSGFLGGLFQENYFAGTTPSEAYFVKCDSTNNTAETIEAGKVIIDVGVAYNKPAEFVVFRFTQKSV